MEPEVGDRASMAADIGQHVDIVAGVLRRARHRQSMGQEIPVLGDQIEQRRRCTRQPSIFIAAICRRPRPPAPASCHVSSDSITANICIIVPYSQFSAGPPGPVAAIRSHGESRETFRRAQDEARVAHGRTIAVIGLGYVGFPSRSPSPAPACR